jgi:hypothetical protein
VAARKKDHFVLAIGTPDQWHFQASLPPTAVVTNLVEAAIHEPRVAEKLWPPFLRYVYHASVRDTIFRAGRLLLNLREELWWIHVSVLIADATVATAVAAAIRRSPCPRFRVRLNA